MAGSSDDYDNYFAGIASQGQGAQQAASPSAASPNWEAHFTAIAPKAPTSSPAVVPQDSSWTRYPKLVGAALTTGLESTFGAGGSIRDAFGANPKTPWWAPAATLPSTSDFANATNTLGLTNRPEAQPTGQLERFGTAGIEALPAAALAIASGGATVPSLLSAEGGAFAGEGAHELFPDSKIAPVVAGAAGGLMGQGLASLVSGNTVEKIASGLGESQTLQQAGAAAQDAARNWKVNVMPAKLEAVAAPLAAAIPAKTPVSLSNYSDILKNITTRAGDLQASADVLTPQGAKRLSNALTVRDQLNELAGGEAGAPTTWANARTLRTVVGNAMADPALVKDIGQQNLEKLYAGLSQDLGTTAKAQGVEDLWDNYNTESTRLYRFAAGPLSKVISSDNPATETLRPEDIASRLLSAGKKGATTLEDLREEVPNAVDELAAAHLRGTRPWISLSPEARAALVPDPDQRLALDVAAPQVLPGNTVPSNAVESLLGGAAGHAAAAVAQHIGIGHGGPLATGAAELIGGALPLVYQGGKALLKNPLQLRGPITGGVAGAIAGQNPLGLPQQP